MKPYLLALTLLLSACRTAPEPPPEPVRSAAPRPKKRPRRAPKPPPETPEQRAERIARWETGVRAFLSQERDTLRACYDAELRRVEEEAVLGAYRNGEPVPPLAGSVTLAVPIETDGAVRAPRLEANTLANPNVDECLLREAMRWNLPPPPTGEGVEVEVPLKFQLMGR